MDDSLGDSLALERAMGVDFEAGSDSVVDQGDIILDSTDHDVGMPMEFEQIEEGQVHMDSEGQEIIVPGYMGDQFVLQEYSVKDEQISWTVATQEANQQSTTAQQELPFKIQASTAASSSIQPQTRYITVKAATSPVRPVTSVLRNEPIVVNAAPRQVPIAPKPPKIQPKHQLIAPKPLAIAPKASPKPVSVVKKVSLSSIVHNAAKSGQVLAQIGKQLVMVPASATGGQKFKLVSAPSVQVRTEADEGNKVFSIGQAPKMARFIVQKQGVGAGVGAREEPAVIARVPGQQPRFVTMQKTVPIPASHQVIMASPTKQGVRYIKKCISNPTVPHAPTTKKVVISANPQKNVILNSSTTTSTAQLTEDGRIINIQGQKRQLHQIKVPGKGVQYIRLVSKSNQNDAPKPKQSVLMPKPFVIASDGQGNKVLTSQPPLVMTGSAGTLNKVTSKPVQKFVKIAPSSAKPLPDISMATRSPQSLLAPRSPAPPAPTPSAKVELEPVFMQEVSEYTEVKCMPSLEPVDSKESLRGLISQTETRDVPLQDFDIELDKQAPDESTSSMDQSDFGRLEEQLIVIPSFKDQAMTNSQQDGSESRRESFNFESDFSRPRSPSPSQPTSDTDANANPLSLRPRKACNCTKSQCLKLYCDCFANGEFCNQCNCNNCHNNLENEALRHKAIKGCLDRNPNAFRPKIGKSKAGGPEIIRRHNKGCNCKRSGCLKNYCECYEAKIACSAICKCVGCRNVEDTLDRRRSRVAPPAFRVALTQPRQPCSFMTSEVIEAVCQCLIAAAVENGECEQDGDSVGGVLEEFARCLQDIIGAAHQQALPIMDEAV